MKLAELYRKAMEIYLVGKKLNITERIAELEILEYSKIGSKLIGVNFKIELIKMRGFDGSYNIIISRFNPITVEIKPMRFEELSKMFNEIKQAGNENGLNDLEIGKLEIKEINIEKTKLLDVSMDLEMVKISGKENYFIQKTEVSKSGLIVC